MEFILAGDDRARAPAPSTCQQTMEKGIFLEITNSSVTTLWTNSLFPPNDCGLRFFRRLSSFQDETAAKTFQIDVIRVNLQLLRPLLLASCFLLPASFLLNGTSRISVRGQSLSCRTFISQLLLVVLYRCFIYKQSLLRQI